MRLGVLFVSALLASGAARAAERTQPEQPPVGPAAADGDNKVNKPARPVLGFTPEREAAAIEFVRRHHPELAALLAQLKKTDAAEYHRAVFGVSERLARLQERDPEAYQWELKTWKLSSRIQLLVARIGMTPGNEKLRRELEQALAEQLELRRQRLVEERRRLLDRVEKLDDQIRQTQDQRDALVKRQVEALLRDKKKRGTRDTNSPQPASTPANPPP
jgi:hypothetical protein